MAARVFEAHGKLGALCRFHGLIIFCDYHHGLRHHHRLLRTDGLPAGFRNHGCSRRGRLRRFEFQTRWGGLGPARHEFPLAREGARQARGAVFQHALGLRAASLLLARVLEEFPPWVLAFWELRLAEFREERELLAFRVVFREGFQHVLGGFHEELALAGFDAGIRRELAAHTLDHHDPQQGKSGAAPGHDALPAAKLAPVNQNRGGEYPAVHATIRADADGHDPMRQYGGRANRSHD